MRIFEWKNKSVLITGVDGFIGSALAIRLINLGARVHGVVNRVDIRRPVYGAYLEGDWKIAAKLESIHFADIRDYVPVQQAVIETRPDVIFHLAAITQVKDAELMPLIACRTNVMGTANVLEAARYIGAQGFKPVIVTASSDKAYGHPVELPLNEDSRLNPFHPYDATKAAADMLAHSYAFFYDMKIAVTRFANVFGPGDFNWQRLIPSAIRSFMRGERPIIRSDGTLVREFIYIDDVTGAYKLLAETLAQEPDHAHRGSYTLSSHEPLTVLEVVDVIRTLMRIEDIEPLVLGESTTETQKISLEDRRIRSLGWHPAVTFEHGMMRTISWMAQYLNQRGGEITRLRALSERQGHDSD